MGQCIAKDCGFEYQKHNTDQNTKLKKRNKNQQQNSLANKRLSKFKLPNIKKKDEKFENEYPESDIYEIESLKILPPDIIEIDDYSFKKTDKIYKKNRFHYYGASDISYIGNEIENSNKQTVDMKTSKEFEISSPLLASLVLSNNTPYQSANEFKGKNHLKFQNTNFQPDKSNSSNLSEENKNYTHIFFEEDYI